MRLKEPLENYEACCNCKHFIPRIFNAGTKQGARGCCAIAFKKGISGGIFYTDLQRQYIACWVEWNDGCELFERGNWQTPTYSSGDLSVLTEDKRPIAQLVQPIQTHLF